MKTKISVPIMLKTLEDYGCDNYVKKLKEICAERVFLAFGTMDINKQRREQTFISLEKYIEYFKKNGFEVGVWYCAFTVRKAPFVKQVSCFGEKSEGYCCPADEDFVMFAKKFIEQVAKCGPDIIMFDDDFRYVYQNLGCCCEKHLKLLSENLGRQISGDDVRVIFEGKDENGDRKKWLEVMGSVFERFVLEMRKAIDSVNSSIRFGFCSNGSTWGIDGFDAINISKIMAGKTKPFNRFIGAPYWPVFYGFRLGYVADIERMQASWAKESGMETIAEGDVFPRPRYAVPACYLECMDEIIRADGNFDGILKYVIDYSSDVEYETGYIERHLKNKALYEYLETNFSNKKNKGVRVYKYMCELDKVELPKPFESAHYMQTFFYPHESKFLTSASIPTSFDCDGVGVCFGYNAYYLTEESMNNGLVLDVVAAKILTERGFEVGLKEIKGKIEPRAELFASGRRVKIWDTKGVYEINFSEYAKTESEYLEFNDWTGEYYEGEEKRYPAAYSYENSKGQRFFVLAVDAKECGESIYRSYDKAKQLTNAFEFVGREVLPVKCFGNPDLYVLLKEDDNELCVGLWNLHADYVENASIILSNSYKKVELFNGSGKLNGKILNVDRIDAFGFVGVTLWK